MQWDLGVHAGVAVLSIGGYLPDQDADRLAGAVGWACAHSNGPLVLDLTGLRGWSPQGQSSLGAAARGWAAERRILVLCLPAATPLTVTDQDLAGLTQSESVPDAVAALDSLGRHR